MTHYCDVHLDAPSDTVCTVDGVRYPLEGAKYIHDSSGDWSITSGNRLRHIGTKEEKYRLSAIILATCPATAVITLDVGQFTPTTQGVQILSDLAATASVVTTWIGPIPLTGIITMPAGPCEIEFYVSSDTDATTLAVSGITIDLVGLE